MPQRVPCSSGFTPAAMERLTAFDWPGNARQLQNEIQRTVLLSEGNRIDAPDLSVTTIKAAGPEASQPIGDAVNDVNYTLLEGVLIHQI